MRLHKNARTCMHNSIESTQLNFVRVELALINYSKNGILGIFYLRLTYNAVSQPHWFYAYIRITIFLNVAQLFYNILEQILV